MDTALAPGYIRVTYDGVLFPHHMVIPINFSGTPTPGTEPDLILKDASTDGAESAIGALVTLFLPFFNASTHFGLAEVHAVDDITGEDTFIYAWNLGLIGTASAANTPMVEDVYVFKLSTGGLYKLYLMENSNTPNGKELPPYSNASVLALSDFVVGATSPIYGRTNAYPFTPVSHITKTNDKLRKQQGLA